MIKESNFFSFSNTIKEISHKDFLQTKDYLEPIKAIARTSYQSIYIINYQNKGFEYVSENPLFLCGHTAAEVEKMGHTFYFKYVAKSDMDLLLKANKAGFEFYDKLPINERKNYTLSYDFSLKSPESKEILINQKFTPLFLTKKGEIWKALCIISLSSSKTSGNIKIFKKGDSSIHRYNLETNHWETSQEIKLTKREKEVLLLSSRGYTIDKIADTIFLSPDTIKFHRRKLFKKLEVFSISEAIGSAIINNLV